MRTALALVVAAAALTACGDTAATSGPAATAPPLASTAAAASTASSATTTAPPPPSTRPDEGSAWPPADGDPPWRTVELGLSASTHVRVRHGPLGFVSVELTGRGAVVRVSADGVAWRETGVLRGPGGERQVSVGDLAVTGDGYVVVGEAWEPEADSPGDIRRVVWRSRDGAAWDAFDLAALHPHAQGSRLAATGGGIVLVGALVDPETSAATPAIWQADGEGGWVEVTSGEPAFTGPGWVDGVAAESGEVWAWGTDDSGQAVAWRRDADGAWQRHEVPSETGHVAGIASLGDGYVAVGDSHAWRTDDGAVWRQAAGPEAFLTDAVGPGVAFFGRPFAQDGFVLAAAAVGERFGQDWCFERPGDCRRTRPTVLASPDGADWRELPLPGPPPALEHPVEHEAFLVDGKLAVLHPAPAGAVVSILEEVRNARPLGGGAAPDLPFEVAKPGDRLEPGQTYGLAVYTHCGLPTIGPFNGVMWTPTAVDVTGEVPGMGDDVYGTIRLAGDERLEFSVADHVIAVYTPDPDAVVEGCY